MSSVAERISQRNKPFNILDLRERDYRVFVGRYLNWYGDEDENNSIRVYATHTKRTDKQLLYVLNTLWTRMAVNKKNQPRDGVYSVKLGTKLIRLKIKTQAVDKKRFASDAMISYYDLSHRIYVVIGTINCGEFAPWHNFAHNDELSSAVTELLSDPIKALKASGHQTMYCGICNKLLTKYSSIRSGIHNSCLHQ